MSLLLLSSVRHKIKNPAGEAGFEDLVALSQVDRRIDLAARGLGASVAQRAFKVILPNIRFGIVTALLLSFVLSWEEIGVTLFVSSVNAVTLPRLMWMGLRDNIDPAIAAISVLLILVTVTVLLARGAVRRVLAARRGRSAGSRTRRATTSWPRRCRR